jgi:hypothetical protein
MMNLAISPATKLMMMVQISPMSHILFNCPSGRLQLFQGLRPGSVPPGAAQRPDVAAANKSQVN